MSNQINPNPIFRIFICLLLAFVSFRTIAQPVAKFSFAASSTCYRAGDAISVGFTDESIAGPHTSEWYFGDGSSPSRSANPTWTYTAAGVYYVTLTIKTTTNETASTTQKVIIFPAPVPTFVADTDKGCLPLKIIFTDLTKDPEIKDPVTGIVYKEKISSRQWSFGDGIIASTDGSITSNTYTRAGMKDISLTVLTEGGCSAFAQKRGMINAYKPSRADFYLPPPNACQYPVTIQSINTSLDATSYKWFVTGPSPAQIENDTVTDAKFIFDKPGTYTIRLVAKTDDGCTSERLVDFLLPSSTVSASFSSVDTACSNTNIKFTNTSSPDPLSNKWYVNGVQVGDQKDLTYFFASSGQNLVRLDAQFGACITSFEKTVFVNPLPDVRFGADTLEACSFPFDVNFTDSTKGNIIKRVWEFGDGGVLTDFPPYPSVVSHTYKSEGFFSVRLTLTTDKNCTANKFVQNLIKNLVKGFSM